MRQDSKGKEDKINILEMQIKKYKTKNIQGMSLQGKANSPKI